MRRLLVLLFTVMSVAAACGVDTATETADAPVEEPADAPGEEPTQEPADDDAPAVEPEPQPEPTATPEPEPQPEPTATPEPTPVPIEVVGLVPLPGALLDFSAAPVERSGLVWSLYSGSGGVIVENVGGPLPPGCHGTSFFDTETFELLQVDGRDAHAYASVDDGCGGMQQEVEEGVIDGDAVKVELDQLILFDFGALPEPPFDVSTQIVDPDGQNGIFRAADPEARLVVNDLSTATHLIGASGLHEIDPDTGLLRPVETPVRDPGPGCDELVPCLLDGRFQLDLLSAEGSPASVLAADDDGGLYFFFGPENWEVLVKVIDGCAVNRHYWVFAVAATDIEYDLTVTDTATGESRTYGNELGQASPAITDTEAFATCP